MGNARRKEEHQTIGEIIKAARLHLNLTCDEVGEMLNVSRSRVYQWEAGDYIFEKNLKPISVALGIPLKKLEQANKVPV